MNLPTLNIGILAHVDAGKTSLTERLLFDNGVIKQLGKVNQGNTQTDSMDLERQRGITIKSAVVTFNLENLQINLIDTPGHPDFIAEVERAVRVLDAVILVISAVEGVQPQTRVLMRLLKKLKLPTLIFINKIDRMGARDTDLLEEIKQKLDISIIQMNSVENIGTSTAKIKVEKLSHELQSIIKEARIYPIYFGSALTGEGVTELTAGVDKLLSTAIPKNTNSEISGIVFAVNRTKHGEKNAYLRLFSGELKEKQLIKFYRTENGVVNSYVNKIGKLEVVGKPHETTLISNNIAKLSGIHQVRVGDYIGDKNSSMLQNDISKPTLTAVIQAKESEQKVRLHSALRNLSDEDPLIQLNVIESGATSVLLYGAVQREVIESRLKNEYGLDVIFEDLKPTYFERLMGTGKSLWDFDPHAQSEVFWARIGLRIEPAPIGTGNKFVRETKSGQIPLGFDRAIEESVLNTLKQGLYGWPITDCIVTLTDVGFNAPTSVAADFRNLTPIVLMRALKIAGTQVYEPYDLLEVEVQSKVISNLIGFVVTIGGELKTTINKGEYSILTIELPTRTIQNLSSELPSLSHGEGAILSSSTSEFRAIYGTTPIQKRFDGNPLNYEEYMGYVARGRKSALT